jgi:protein associated with RNAse G/E
MSIERKAKIKNFITLVRIHFDGSRMGFNVYESDDGLKIIGFVEAFAYMDTEDLDVETFNEDLERFLASKEYTYENCHISYDDDMAELVERIKKADTWDLDDCEELCGIAGISYEWEAAEEAEEFTEKAAEILGVNLYQ